MGDVQLSGTSAFPREGQRSLWGINYCMYLPKENSTPGEKWVNDTQRIGAGMENAICSDPKLWECSLSCGVSDSFLGSPPCCGCVMCLALVHVLERGRVSQGHCSLPGHLLPPPCPCLLLGPPKKHKQRESIWLLGKSLGRRRNDWGLSVVFAAAPVWSPVKVCCDPAHAKGIRFNI